MASLLFGLPCVRQRRARSYRYNDSILIYNNQKSFALATDLAEPQLNTIQTSQRRIYSGKRIVLRSDYYNFMRALAYCKVAAIQLR